MAEVRKIETHKRVNMETIQLGPVGGVKDTIGLVKKKNPKRGYLENQSSYTRVQWNGTS